VYKTYRPVKIPAPPWHKNSGLFNRVLHKEFTNEEDGQRYVDILAPVVSAAKNDTEMFPSVHGAPERKIIIGYVQIGLTQEGFNHEINQFLTSALLVTAWVALSGVLITLLITRKIISPLKRLKLATQGISEGKFDHRIQIETNDEISDLTRSFNQMLEDLRSFRAQVEERNVDLTAANQQMQEEIDERKQVEGALRESEERYRTAIEHSNDGIVIDKGGRHLFVNQKFVDIFGYDNPEEVVGKPLSTIVHPDDLDRVKETVLKRQKGEVVQACYEFKGIRKNGEVLDIEVSATKTIYRGEIVSLVYLRDITERKRTEEEKVILQEQLRQSQKMEAIGQLAGGIAHDFNNLLTVIKGYCQFSLPELKKDDPLRENILEIDSAADRAANLTRQILAFSRRQVMEMQVLDVNTLLRDLDKMLRRVIGEDIELVTLLAADLGRIKTDPGQIEQVVMNLAVNARDAMPNGGKLTIETANVELDQAYARSHISVVAGRYVMFSVSDTGVGMTPNVRDRIFEPFFTTKEKGKGTGLGLSTVYGIVKQSDGNIWVYSEPGHGTTFKIYLPRVDEPLEEARKGMVKDGLPLGKETILLVEDEQEVRRLTAKILEKQGYEVLEASNGDEAFAIGAKWKNPIHLLLTDVIMPGMSGCQLVDQFSTVYQDIKVLYMSGYTDSAIVHHGVLEEGSNYLQKPFTPNTLACKVRQVLDS
jgi:PAS domain S-box-containing protein